MYIKYFKKEKYVIKNTLLDTLLFTYTITFESMDAIAAEFSSTIDMYMVRRLLLCNSKNNVVDMVVDNIKDNNVFVVGSDRDGTCKIFYYKIKSGKEYLMKELEKGNIVLGFNK